MGYGGDEGLDRETMLAVIEEQAAAMRECDARLVAEAEDTGLDPEKILAEIEGMAEAMRLCVEE